MGGNSGGREASRVDSEPHGVEWEEGGLEVSGVEENPGRCRHRVGVGVELSLDHSTCHGEGGGVESSQGNSTPMEGEGVESW